MANESLRPLNREEMQETSGGISYANVRFTSSWIKALKIRAERMRHNLQVKPPFGPPSPIR